MKNWTKTVPTRPGRYWVRIRGYQTSLVPVFLNADDLTAPNGFAFHSPLIEFADVEEEL